MKKYKNIHISLSSYILAALVSLLWTYVVPTSPESPNWTGLILFTLLILTGIFFGFRSNYEKESSWAGKIMILIGLLILVSPIILFYIGAHL